MQETSSAQSTLADVSTAGHTCSSINLPAGEPFVSMLTPADAGSKSSKMYNLNVNVNVSSGESQAQTQTPANNHLAVGSSCTTPRTPEILNSLMAMTNPLDDYSGYNGEKKAAKSYKNGSVIDSTSNSSGSPLGSPANGSPPSIQQTCSQLIKAGLKLSIESKRKMSGSDSASEGICVKKMKKEETPPSDEDYDSANTVSNQGDGLTPEDEERRRRRRERNKIAATKCRLKKRERTVNLVTESEVLETQNIDLKTQIQELEVQRRQLVDMLSSHSPSCIKNNNNNTANSSAANSPTAPYHPIQPYESPQGYQPSASYEANSPYIRPESANILASSYSCLTINNGNITEMPSSMDIIEVSPQYMSMDQSYSRPDSVMSQQMADMQGYPNENYIQKQNGGLLIIENSVGDYMDQIAPFDGADLNTYQLSHIVSSQAYHNFSSGNQNGQKQDHIDNGCMA